jgi:hypothetical protein
MKRPPKNCINCKFDVATCDWRPLDKRQIRKLNRTAIDGYWSRYYCKNHKYSKCIKNLQGVMWELIEKEVE